MAARRVRIKGIANIPVRKRNETTTAVEETKEDDTVRNDEVVYDDNVSTNVSTNTTVKPTLLTRRRIAKPLVKLPVIARKPKIDINITVKQNETTNETSSIPESPQKIILETPLSPNKTVNRARIRPVPRLIRRTSIQGSASESDTEELRKSFSRTRNDSVCSIPGNDTIINNNNEISKDKKINVISNRKVKYTEQSRKVAIARKEFNIKFGTHVPDRKKLTMMDLIFYNPTTNPMPEKETKSITKKIIQTVDFKEDDPDEPESIASDEENIPVPQVKVGPDGEIILDEKSLVIEQAGTKRAREQIENSEIIIDDLDTGYGIYKRPKKTKDWSASETLRFYRAMNTVGTDFSLMLSLFPGRTRRELKLKFKKEERINRVLVDRVLMNPLDFNLEELEEQFKTELEAEKRKNESKKPKEKQPERPQQKNKRSRKSLLSREIEDANEPGLQPIRKRLKPTENKFKKFKYSSVLKSGMNGIIDSDSEEEIPVENVDKDAVERPKRTCRIVNPSTYALIDGDSDIEEIPNNDYDKENNITNLEPSEDEIVRDTVISHTNKQPNDIDTNIVIAHSENPENDMISIDIVQKTSDKDTKVSLELKKQELMQIESSLKSNESIQNDKSDSTTINEREEVLLNSEKIIQYNEKTLPDNLAEVEPGSLMILSSLDENGDKVYKVYMVTPNRENIPVDLAPDVVQSLATSLGSAEEVVMDLPVISK